MITFKTNAALYLLTSIMESNVFYCQLQPSQPSHRNIVLYNLTGRILTFYKTITRKYISHQLHALTLLISRQQALLQYHGVSLLNNDVFTVTSNTKCITISTKYIASMNLQEWQQQLATQLTRCDQIIDFNSIVRRLMSLLMREVRYLIPTYKNVLIINNSQIYLNMSSTIGWKLLIFEEQIAAAQFRQMCMFIDRNIFERSPQQRINYRVQQRSLCIILLSLVAQQLFNLPNTLKLPQLIDVNTAKVLLLQIDTKIHKFLQIKQIRDRIKQKSQESGIDLLLLFESILIPTQSNIKRSVMWSDILQLLMPINIMNQNLSLVLSHLAHQQWAQLTTIQQQTYSKHGLFQLKNSDKQWNHYEVQILLLHILRQKLDKGYIFDRIMSAKESSVMTQQSLTLSHKLQQLIISHPNKQEQQQMPYLCDSNMKASSHDALLIQPSQLSSRFHNCMVLAKWCQSHQITHLITHQNQLNISKDHHRLTALKMYHQL